MAFTPCAFENASQQPNTQQRIALDAQGSLDGLYIVTMHEVASLKRMGDKLLTYWILESSSLEPQD